MRTNHNFTPRAQQILKNAFDLALETKRKQVDPDHLLLSLLEVDAILVNDVLKSCGVPPKQFHDTIRENIEYGQEEVQKCKYSDNIKKVLTVAQDCSSVLEHDYIGLEHVFYGLFKVPDEKLDLLLVKAVVNKKYVAECIEDFFQAEKEEEQVTYSPNTESKANIEAIKEEVKSTSLKNLELYAENYNELAKAGKFDKVICREEELDQMYEILCRRGKNNPVLLGDPGVGKTALVEALSQKITSSTAPDMLLSRVVYALDLPAMVAGTKYRGQFEERLKNVVEEVKNNPNIILFVDEIHTLVGAGSAEGTMDASNILKPLLARGEIRCVGATTQEEYKKTIGKDGALDRRFQSIKIEEPCKDKTLQILNGIVKSYSKYHDVIYSKNKLELVVDLCTRFIHDKNFPDKAIDILDQAGSKAKIREYTRPEEAKSLEVEIERLFDVKNPSANNIKLQTELFERYKEILEKWADDCEERKVYVTNQDIYEVVSNKTGIPISRLSYTKSKAVTDLQKNLNKEVVGQQQAITKIYESILRSNSGICEENKPLGSFLFLGQSGVGKTHIAKMLAKHLFGGEDKIIQFDMSEFSDKINGSRLVGSAPGYVGYEEGGQLTEKIRKNPYSVILFDEIEKASQEVTQMLLQVLEEGKITDNFGKVANFKNSVIIMTGNVGAEFTEKSPSLGFGQSESSDRIQYEQKVFEEVKKSFKPEFLNRIDEIVVFNGFKEDSYKKILNIEFNKIKDRVSTKGINIQYDSTFEEFIIEEVQKQNYGARLIKRLLQKNVENTLALDILNKKIKAQESIEFYCEDLSVSYNKAI